MSIINIHGFLVTASCNNEVQNNLTYVTSPGFPNLIDRPMNCSVVVRKIDTEVSQLRIDFVHFNIVSFRDTLLYLERFIRWGIGASQLSIPRAPFAAHLIFRESPSNVDTDTHTRMCQ